MPVIVVIGANNFFWEERSFFRLFASMSALTRESFRMVVVEPVPDFIPFIRDRANRLGIPSGQVLVVQAAVARHCAQPEVSFYKLSSAVPDYDRLGFGAGGLSNSSAMVQSVQAEILRGSGVDPAKADLSEYIVKATVPCLTPAGLLAKAGAAASDVAYLKVDAEGKDIEIALAFLDGGARPAFLMAEAISGDGAVCKRFGEHPLVLSLRAAGYLVGGHCDRTSFCSLCSTGASMPQDILALDPRFISSPA